MVDTAQIAVIISTTVCHFFSGANFFMGHFLSFGFLANLLAILRRSLTFCLLPAGLSAGWPQPTPSFPKSIQIEIDKRSVPSAFPDNFRFLRSRGGVCPMRAMADYPGCVEQGE
jgi:hypothetical protein